MALGEQPVTTDSPGTSAAGGSPPVLPVSLLVSSARLILERHLGVVWVGGEISNLYRAPSGHVYFTLKDESAQVKCTLWRSKAQLVGFALADGLAVEVRATPSIYEQRGEFQLNVDAVRRAGLGALYERFLRLRAELGARGFLDPARKRPLPRFPRRVGVVTSPRGAALRDVLATLHRRWPSLPVIVYPALVQGEGAAREIAEAIAVANARAEVDVLVVCRGGGSIEDLWAFNEEAVAVAVFESALPVISGVGHETDVTICDLVADVRAPTPTGAATLVVPDIADYRHRAAQLANRLARAAMHALERRSQALDAAARRLVHPAARLDAQRERLRDLAGRLARGAARAAREREVALAAARQRLVRELRAPLEPLERCATLRQALVRAARERLRLATTRVDALGRGLALLDPEAVLERGYAIVATGDGAIVSDAAALAPGDALTITLARGSAEATVTKAGSGSAGRSATPRRDRDRPPPPRS
jgi:exodeoxyribonuclease VII large subunit